MKGRALGAAVWNRFADSDLWEIARLPDGALNTVYAAKMLSDVRSLRNVLTAPGRGRLGTNQHFNP